ncbi:hypothetical protein E6C67_14315 [Azospirillum sp. TSA2s]|uniref:hypothetical protein n=1 Tax=Azospirillum sp. TSA2s TaxID=709810 RepID=UPI0010AAF023|nr:hypothetical protein [Azospirillum sp. TSA2s]QCG95002.1 hypothetical protein E6C67_14315 [Azospirillum sp. TSA2s]
MTADRCPTGGLERADWMRREAAEWDDAGNADRAAYCRRVAAQIEQRELHSRPLCALMMKG